MSKIDFSSFPPLIGTGSQEVKKKTGAWFQSPRRLPHRPELTERARLGGLWISRWRSIKIEFFSKYTCGWILDIIDQPISRNPKKEAQTFFNWFLDDLTIHQFDSDLVAQLTALRSSFQTKIMKFLKELREDPPALDQETVLMAHWYITLDNYQAASSTYRSALLMVQAGRRDLDRMVGELSSLIERGHQYTDKIEQALQAMITFC